MLSVKLSNKRALNQFKFLSLCMYDILHAFLVSEESLPRNS